MEKIADNLPNHVVIIPDGNRRWAKQRGLQAWEGHEEGAKNTEKLIRFALKKGVKCISIWGSSMDNLTKRSLLEKKALLDIYKRYFTKLISDEELYSQEVKVNVIGRWEEQFPDSLKKIIRELIDKTKNYKKKILNFMLAYSGTDDMLSAIQKINDNCEKAARITADKVKENLMTSEIPAVDYMIRTGGEPHLSAGFMMWDTADAQLYFFEKMYPDFNEKKFEESLQEYSRRQRRFGR